MDGYVVEQDIRRPADIYWSHLVDYGQIPLRKARSAFPRSGINIG